MDKKKISSILTLLDANESLGKTFIQKALYILEEGLGIDLGYTYKLHFYGPYSRDLANDLDFLENFGLVKIQFRESKGYFIKITDAGKEVLYNELIEYMPPKEKIKKINSLLGEEKTRQMELLGTTLYFRKLTTDDSELIELVNTVKPHFNPKEIKEAIQKINNIH